MSIVLYAIRFSFVLGFISLAIAKSFLPEFLQYGKTFKKIDSKQASLWTRVKRYTVPKACFAHFYYVSTTLSLLTLTRYPGYLISWLLLAHSARRLYETLYISQYSTNSRMNWSHYIVGLWFYTVLHLIVNINLHKKQIPRYKPSWPWLVVWLIASWDQHENHKVLAGLVKYSLPQKRLFTIVCCPHYFDEWLIYASLASCHTELYWPFIWVVANLGISSFETRRYYNHKFGTTENVPRYAIVPFLL